MSPYAKELAHARLDALRALIAALNEAQTPDEKRRCAVAILNAPDPCDLDDEIELEEEPQDEPVNDAPAADPSAHTTDTPIIQLAPSAAAAPQPDPPTSTSDIALAPPDIEPTPAQRRLHTREARQHTQMQCLAAQLAALPIPAS